jgi:hypothetical protein
MQLRWSTRYGRVVSPIPDHLTRFIDEFFPAINLKKRVEKHMLYHYHCLGVQCRKYPILLDICSFPPLEELLSIHKVKKTGFRCRQKNITVTIYNSGLYWLCIRVSRLLGGGDSLRWPIPLDTVLDNPWMPLDLIKRNPLFGIENEELTEVSASFDSSQSRHRLNYSLN